MPRQFTGSSI